MIYFIVLICITANGVFDCFFNNFTHIIHNKLILQSKQMFNIFNIFKECSIIVNPKEMPQKEIQYCGNHYALSSNHWWTNRKKHTVNTNERLPHLLYHFYPRSLSLYFFIGYLVKTKFSSKRNENMS